MARLDFRTFVAWNILSADLWMILTCSSLRECHMIHWTLLKFQSVVVSYYGCYSLCTDIAAPIDVLRK